MPRLPSMMMTILEVPATTPTPSRPPTSTPTTRTPSTLMAPLTVMAKTPRHTYLILTKRPERILECYEWLRDNGRAALLDGGRFPLPNVWVGVTVENQKAADERIPILGKIPAAVRFLSCEPLLGNIQLGLVKGWNWMTTGLINWVICGGESGPNARPMHPDWATNLRDQCVSAEVPFFFKQWGEWRNGPLYANDHLNKMVLDDGRVCVNPADLGFSGSDSDEWLAYNPCMMSKVGKGYSGRVLDLQFWDQYPKGVR